MPWDNHHLDIHAMKALHLSPGMILSWLCLCLLLFVEHMLISENANVQPIWDVGILEPREAITSPSADSDFLMNFASFDLSSSTSVLAKRSLPTTCG